MEYVPLGRTDPGSSRAQADIQPFDDVATELEAIVGSAVTR